MRLAVRVRQNQAWFRFTAALFIAVVSATPSRAASNAVDFAHDILPIIKSRCAACHTNGTYMGNFSLDTRETALKSKAGAVVAGNSAKSLLVKRITSSDPKFRMPPQGDPLTPQQIQLFKDWIDQGIQWQEGFSFKNTVYLPPLKPRRVTLPPARNGRSHPIDRIIDAHFAQRKIAPPPALDDVTFVRRASLDVIGLLPTPEEVSMFANDIAPDKRTRWIRRLLDDRRAYADHCLTFWNDLLRNDYAGTGYIDGGRKAITGWLYRSLMENKPYDQFVRELIHPTPESEGFIKGIKWRGRVNASQVPEIQFSQNVSQVFFGINMKCASCHDSFIDNWKLDDAYGLAAVIADAPLEIHRCDKPTGKTAKPRFVFPELGDIDANAPKEKRLEQLSRLVTHPDNGRFTRTMVNRVWHRLMGRGIVHPVDAMGTPPWSEDLLDYLATYLSDNGYDLKKLIEHICTSRAYQSRSVVRPREPTVSEYVFRGPDVKRMTAEQFLDAVWMVTGAGPTQPTQQVAAVQKPISDLPDAKLVRASLVNADALMRSLGRPNREQVVTTRPDLLTTLQALDLSNGQILHDLVTRGAQNILKSNPSATREQLIETIYLRALSRKPTSQELATARELIGDPVTPEGLADLLWAVFMLPEFQLIR